MMVLPSCAAGEEEGAAGYSITIIPQLPPPTVPWAHEGAARGCRVTWLCRGSNRLVAQQANVNVHACVRACARVCETVTGLNLPVGNVIKAPHTAGSDAGTGAAAEKGININWARIKDGPPVTA